MIDILKIEPNVISRDLKGKYIAIYGDEKVGKTTFAAQQPKTLICAFEIGYKWLPNVSAVPIDSWATFLTVLRQLQKSEAKEKYDCIAIDTVGEAYRLCEEYICSQNRVTKIGDIPYGGGWVALRNEFEKALRKITMLGYGIITIAHSQKKSIEVDEDTYIEKVSPSMPARAAEIVNRLVDIIGYIKVDWEKDENGEAVAKRTLITRATPTILAGSRLKYLESEIPFGYDELVNAIGDAIEKESAAGAKVVDKQVTAAKQEIDFATLKNEAKDLWEKILSIDESLVTKLTNKIVENFGNLVKLSEVEEDQKELMNLMVLDMREIYNSIS